MQNNKNDYIDKSIEVLNYLLTFYGHEFKSINLGMDVKLAIRNAISALTWRKLTKPYKQEHMYYNEYFCPNCYEKLVMEINNRYLGDLPKYCPECGQRLIWGEDNG